MAAVWVVTVEVVAGTECLHVSLPINSLIGITCLEEDLHSIVPGKEIF